MARIREVAKDRGLQISHVPDLAGVTRSHFWDVLGGRKSPTLMWLGKICVVLRCEPWELLSAGGQGSGASSSARRLVPLLSVSALAGGFSDSTEVVPLGWVTTPPGREVKKGMFALTVSGRSMEPLIPSGSICLFRPMEDQDPNGRVVLVQFRDAQDPETGGRYTVKRFRLVRRDGQVWRVRLEPLNRGMEPMVLAEDPMSHLTLAGEFLEVLVRPSA